MTRELADIRITQSLENSMKHTNYLSLYFDFKVPRRQILLLRRR